MKIAIGADHGGYEMKEGLMDFLKKEGHEVEDMGTHSKDACDYPVIGLNVAAAVSSGKADRGVLICKTGVGMTVAANKVPLVRAAACYNNEIAASCREHNDCNVIVFAANYTSLPAAREMLSLWLKAPSASGRHARRVGQITDFESKRK